MKFGRVVGSAICTSKYTGLEGLKLLLVQPLDKHLQPQGERLVAVDVVQAGVGDLCVMARSREAALAMPEIKFVPVDLALIGIVDQYEIKPDGEPELHLKAGWERFS
jgi:ethanolamine utilization protein EutN